MSSGDLTPVDESVALRGYLYGQLGNVAKVAMWWTGSTPLILSLVTKSSAIATTRIAYNIIMLLLSPLAGVVVERNDMKGLLIKTTAGRLFIWSIASPLCWFLFKSGLAGFTSYNALYASIIVLFSADAAAVAFSNVLDIDMGGMDILAASRNIPVDDFMRNKYNGIFELGLSLSFIFIAPALAFLGRAVAEHSSMFGSSSDSHEVVQSGALVAVFMAGNFFFSTASLYFYSWITPAPEDSSPGLDESETVSDKIKAYAEGVSHAWKIIMKHKPIFWRMMFFALELAVEDAFMIVVAPQIAFQTSWLGGGDSVSGNIWTALIVATGKVGAFLAGLLMTSVWTPPSTPKGYLPLFFLVLLGSAFLCLMPVALHYGDLGHEYDLVPYKGFAFGLLFGGSFLFFFFSTAPKLGFMTLFQSMVAQVEASGSIFAWLTCMALVTDAVVIIVMSLIVQFFSLSKALMVIAGLYLAHGFVECFIGPSLVLQKDEGLTQYTEALLQHP